MKKWPIYILSLGHLVTDLNQGAIPAMLPFLVAELDLTYAAAAGIVFAANITSTVVQPIFGHAADRFSKVWLLPLALIFAGFGVAMIGMVDNYYAVLCFAGISGIGIAAYHPEAARRVNLLGGERKAEAMSVFGIGGTLGFASGPIFITTAILWFGLNGSLSILIPVGLVAALVLVYLPSATPTTKKSILHGATDNSDNWRAFFFLTICVTARSILFYGLLTFVPLYWVSILGQTKFAGGMALSVMTISGVIGNLVGGRFADRFGNTRIILCGFGILLVLVPLLILAANSITALLVLIPIGFALMATYAPSVVLGQKYLPNHIGFASGITLGVAVAAGGIAAPFLGRIADTFGLVTVFTGLAVLPLINILITYYLPEPSTQKQT